MGFCDYSRDYRCVKDQKKRVLFRFGIGTFSGKKILSATFTGYNTHSYSCTTDRRVDLWRVAKFYRSVTWNNDDWLKNLASRSVSYCSRTAVEFNSSALENAVQSAASKGYRTISFGLKAYNESSMDSWKRFADDAYLRVRYNTRPTQPVQAELNSDPGGLCATPSEAPTVSRLPKVYATLRDKDSDQLYAQFGMGWDHNGDGNVSEQWRSADPAEDPDGAGGAKNAGSVFSRTLPETVNGEPVPKRTLLYWKVRSWDGAQYSAWSWEGNQTSCYFYWDDSVPAEPAITSTDYPPLNPEDPNDPSYGGVGQYGDFMISSPSGDAVKYLVAINGGPEREYVPQTVGGSVTVPIAPEKAGENVVTAKAVNAAGTTSAPDGHNFRVNAGSGPVAHWKLDDEVDSASVVDSAGGQNTYPATTHAGVSLGVDGVAGTAMGLNGSSGYADTSGAVLDTSKSFAVSAWARLQDDKRQHAGIIATQAGTTRSGFELYYSSYYHRWIFNRYTSDDTSDEIVRAKSPDAPLVGRWTHLVGVFDAVAKELRLYVNGTQVATKPYTATAWNAPGAVQLGAGWYGALGSFFNGEIDDVRIFDRIITGHEAQVLYMQHPEVAARWKLNDAASDSSTTTAYYKLDEAAGATRAEDTNGSYPAGAHGGVAFGADGKIGNGVSLDGSDDYLATSGPVVDTTTSFSVSAWAKLPAQLPSDPGIIATQAGGSSSGFELYYSSFYQEWIFNRYDTDNNDTATIVRARSHAVPQTETWTHLVGVYDAGAGVIKLYVNGDLQETTSYDKPWSADGSVQIGAGWYGSLSSFFEGSIDEVRVYDHALTDSQAAYLAGGTPGTISADDSNAGNDVTLGGQARVDASDAWVGSGALSLDGDDDYAQSATAAVDTTQSFTVAAWVSPAATPTRDATVVSQSGGVIAGFTVRYSPSVGGYQIEIPDSDRADADRQTVAHTGRLTGWWEHVAIVYNAFTATATLYVNGAVQDSETNVSWRANTVTFAATGPLQLGRTRISATSYGEHWSGAIDDAWAFQGVLSGEQVQKLASGEEHPTYGLGL